MSKIIIQTLRNLQNKNNSHPLLNLISLIMPKKTWPLKNLIRKRNKQKNKTSLIIFTISFEMVFYSSLLVFYIIKY